MQSLRQQLGHHLLLCPGVCGLVFDSRGRVLLNRRTDTGRWAVLGGMLDPGEDPAAAVVREVLEETGVQVAPERITGVYLTPVITYPNGDQTQYIVTAFRCHAIAGEPHPADDESFEVRYFALDELPPLSDAHRMRIEHAMNDGPAYFAWPR